jgi:thiamine biosynthesis protein ThiS
METIALLNTESNTESNTELSTIIITLNGDPRQIQAPETVAGLLAAYHLKPAMVVVELNGEIIPRDRYESQPVGQGDQLEIVQMMAGG